MAADGLAESQEDIQKKIEETRERFRTDYAQGFPDRYHASDLERLWRDDDWVDSYLDWKHYVVEDTVKMIDESLQWRKDLNVNGIEESSVDKSFLELGMHYIHGCDKEGHKLFWFRMKLLVKDSSLMQEKKRYVAFWLERHVRREPGALLTVVFDMSEAGLSNLDMEFIRFIIGCFQVYYPRLLSKMLMYQMPWIMNAAWRVVKTWLAQDAIDKLKFVSKSDVHTFIDPEQLPVYMGGSDTFSYSYPPLPDHDPQLDPQLDPLLEPLLDSLLEPTVEPLLDSLLEPTVEPLLDPLLEPTVEPLLDPLLDPTVEPLLDPLLEPTVEPLLDPLLEPTVEPLLDPLLEPTVVPNQEEETKIKEDKEAAEPVPLLRPRKQVCFAEHGDTTETAIRDRGARRTCTTFEGTLLHISPAEELSFGQRESEKRCAIVLDNVTKNPVAYKVRTTAPEKYRVKPSSSSCAAGSTVQITISLHGGSLSSPQDRFLIMAAEMAPSVANQDLARFWKEVPKAKVTEHRLRCHVLQGLKPALSLTSNYDKLTTANGTDGYRDIHTMLLQVTASSSRLEQKLDRCLWIQKVLVALVTALTALGTSVLLMHMGEVS